MRLGKAGMFGRGGGWNRVQRAEDDGGGGGGGAADWRAALPDDLKADPSLKDIKDVATLAKAFRDTKSLVGSSLRVPGQDASEADWAAFDTKLKERTPGLVRLPKDADKQAAALREFGVIPKEEKDYELPAGVEFTPEQTAELRKAATKWGLSKAGFKELVTDRAAQLKEAAEAQQAGQVALKKEWGQAYDEKLAAVRGLVEQTNAPQELKEAIGRGEFSAGVASWLVSMAKSLGTQAREIALQGPSGGAPKLTPREAAAQMKEAIAKSLDPTITAEERADIVDRARRLNAMANPDLA